LQAAHTRGLDFPGRDGCGDCTCARSASAEPRTIVAGIALAYKPEQLVGRKVVIVANLQPRKLRGLTSQGMIVAASLGDGQPVLASFLEDVPVGARLK